MPRQARLTRSHSVMRFRLRLQQESYPRTQMMLIVALTGAAGLLCSFAMLHAGVARMALRYPLATVGAYLFFLFLLWLWMRTRARQDLDDPPLDLLPDGSQDLGFEGGGAESVFEADELAIPLVAVLLAVGMALACLYVVYLAPVLFAELLVDGALSYSLYRRMRHADRRYWLATALRHTAAPFFITAIFLAGSGAAMSHLAPGARSIGEVLHPDRRQVVDASGDSANAERSPAFNYHVR